MTRFALRKPFIAFALALSLLAGFASLDAAPAHAAKMIEELEIEVIGKNLSFPNHRTDPSLWSLRLRIVRRAAT